MEFKINTQTKTITILQQLSVKELKELLEKFNITDDWQVNAVTNNLPSITSGETILSANLGNPYATRVACGLYDPWEKRNRMIYRFFHDLAQSAILGIFPSPVYVSVDIDPKKITSFATLLNQGKVVYHPIYNRRKVHLSLIGDLGPLIGVPCSISISGNPINPLEYYSFDGISFSGCRENGKISIEGKEYTVQDGDIMHFRFNV